MKSGWVEQKVQRPVSKRVHKSFVKAESGATAIEYGLIAALVAVAVIGAIAATGSATGIMFNDIADRAVSALTQNSL
jgi:pilus assembly protein Flp/PilA